MRAATADDVGILVPTLILRIWTWVKLPLGDELEGVVGADTGLDTDGGGVVGRTNGEEVKSVAWVSILEVVPNAREEREEVDTEAVE